MEMDTQEQMPDTQYQYKRKNKTLIILAIVVVLLGFGGIVAFFLIQSEDQSSGRSSDTTNVREDPFSELQGRIYLTLAPAEGDRNGREFADTNEYILDVQTGELTSALPENERIEITSSISPDGESMAYMSSPYDPNTPEGYFYPATEISQLYVYNFRTEEREKITDHPDIAKRQPEWSPDGESIAFYSTQIEKGPIPHDPTDWSIYISDLEGNMELIANGVQPFWSPDGRYILFVGKSALRLYDTVTKTEQTVYEFTVPLTTLMKFDLSDDGTMFARSYPLGNNITLFEITSWDPFQMHTVDRISIQGYAASYWPTFSPDNRYVVFQWADYEPSTDTFFDFQFLVYDTESKERKLLLDARPYRFDAAFINDWVH